MNNLQIFNHPEFGSVRLILIDNEPWLVGKDVAEILGYSNPQKAMRDHVDEEDKGVNESFTPGGKQNLLVINESDFYSLVISSKLRTAKKFKRY
jgi:prophage antirepressor-like protein